MDFDTAIVAAKLIGTLLVDVQYGWMNGLEFKTSGRVFPRTCEYCAIPHCLVIKYPMFAAPAPTHAKLIIAKHECIVEVTSMRLYVSLNKQNWKPQ